MATKIEKCAGLVGGAAAGCAPDGADEDALVAQNAGVIVRGAKATVAKPFGPARPPTKKQEYIKRHGRWASNVVHVYLWEGSGFHSM